MAKLIFCIFLGILVMFACLLENCSSQRPPLLPFRDPRTNYRVRDNRPTQPSESNEEEDEGRYEKLSISVARSVLDLSQRLTTKILEQSSKKFEVLSPISISAALHLAFLGSNGRTFDEIRRALGYDLNQNEASKFHQEFSTLINELLTDVPTRYHKRLPWKFELDKHIDRNMQRFKPEEVLHEIYVANGLFVQKDFSIRDDYKSVVQSLYRSELKTLDFKGEPVKSAKYINDWVNEKTKGKIKELITDGVNSEARVILANALYFKALWLLPFSEGKCCVRDFYPDGPGNPSYKVKLMANQAEFPYYKDTECDVQVLGFPYMKGISTMYVFLPTDSSKSKLKQAQKCLTADKIEGILEQMQEVMATILFPKLHLSGSFNFRSYLKEMGLQTIFDQSLADFSLMSDGSTTRDRTRNNQSNYNDQIIFRNRLSEDEEEEALRRIDKARMDGGLRNPGLFADDVIHKVDLVINERGTEAAAATAITMPKSTQVIFRVDGPFMILIRHDHTRIPLFYGTIFEPVNDL